MRLRRIHAMLLRQLITDLPPDARIAYCCAGKFLERNLRALTAALDGRAPICVLDDNPDKLARGEFCGIPVQPIDFATNETVDAIVIASDSVEALMVERFAPLADAGVRIIRAGTANHNAGVTPALLEAVAASDPTDIPNFGPWDDEVTPAPAGGGVEITTGCNLNCRMCETHEATRGDGNAQISLADFEQSLDAMERIGCKRIILHTIGEPTIHKQFADVLRISHERGFRVVLSTNGMLLNRHLDTLIRWPVEKVRFSADGATKNTYEHIRVGGRFDKLMDNMARLRAAIDEHNLPTIIGLNAAISRDNLHEIPLFYDVYGQYMDEDQITFLPVNSLSADGGGYYQSVRLTVNDVPAVPCSQPWDLMFVGFDGRVSACCRDYHGDLVVGDIHAQPLGEIWRGPQLTELRRAHRERDWNALPDACRQCTGVGTDFHVLFEYYITSLRRHMRCLAPEQFVARLERFVESLARSPVMAAGV